MGEIESGSRTTDLTEDWIDRAVLENRFLRVEVMPALGGKISSIQLIPSGDELLQQPLLPYAPRIPFMHFDDSDASGWDECLPSVAACNVETSSGTVSVPDHGDFWQVASQVNSLHENDLTLSADGFSLPLRFTKALHLENNRLSIAYRVVNSGPDPVEYIWSAHPLFAVDPGDRLVLPPSVQNVIVEGSRGGRLGPHGIRHPWPQTHATNGELCDLSVAGKITDEIGDKLFAAAPHEGWCAIERVRLKRRIELHFDARQVPYFGLWICYGGWPENKTNRQNCVALEPCTAEADSLAVAMKQGSAKQLPPGGEDRWLIELRVTGVL